MGQARNRGTRSQRVAQSIEATRLKEEADKQAAEDWWESLTDDEQQAELKEYRAGKRKSGKIRAIMGALTGISRIHV